MTLTTFLLLAVAGVGTGLVGYLTGLASLVSYPALLAAGLSPVQANVSNTLGLVGIGVGSTARASSMIRGGDRSHLIRQLVTAAVGGLAGALLLLFGGEGAFETVVPWLIILASTALLLQPKLKALNGSGRPRPWLYLLALLLISVYGGYFGAGAGVIYLAVTLIATSDAFGKAMIMKSLLLGITNLVAAITFAFLAPVNWLAALALGLGCLVGGNLGPVVQHLLPPRGLQVFVALCGFGLAVWLWSK